MKKIVKLIILSLLLIIPLSLKAEVNLKERTESNNYGVNKKWKVTESNINNVKNTKYVDSSEKIYDFSNVLTEEEKNELKSLVDDYIDKTKMDMVIYIPFECNLYHLYNSHLIPLEFLYHNMY